MSGGSQWRRIGGWMLVGLSVLAIAAIVASSANPDHYYFRTEEQRRAFAPAAPIGVALALSAAESAVLIAILCVGRRPRLSFRILLALTLFIPWMFVVWDELGTHVPVFLFLNAFWVALIVSFLTIGLAVSVTVHLWRYVGLGRIPRR